MKNFCIECTLFREVNTHDRCEECHKRCIGELPRESKPEPRNLLPIPPPYPWSIRP